MDQPKIGAYESWVHLYDRQLCIQCLIQHFAYSAVIACNVKPLSVALHLAAHLEDHGTNNIKGLIDKEHNDQVYTLNALKCQMNQCKCIKKDTH